MDFKRSEIAPGVGLAVMNTEKFKTDSFVMKFYIPLEKTVASEVSLLSRVMLRGTAAFPSVRLLNHYTDLLYGLSCGFSAAAFGSYQVLTFRIDFLDGRFIPTSENIDIFSEAMKFVREFFNSPLIENGAFSEEYTESEKKLLIDRIRGDIDNKDSYAFKRGKKALLGSHPASISPMGEEEDVLKITPQALYRRFKDIMLNAHVESVYIGVLPDGADELISDTMHSIFSANRVYSPIPKINMLSEDDCLSGDITEDAVAKQGRMILGYLLPYSSNESPAVEIFVEIFGRSPVSRLFKNVRERLSLCYYCSASVDASLGAMFIRSGISEENLSLAREEITRQLADIASGNISDEELEISKRSVISSCRMITDSAFSWGAYYLRRLMFGSFTDVNEYAEAVEAVTLRDVAEIASRVLFKTSYYLRGTDASDSGEDQED